MHIENIASDMEMTLSVNMSKISVITDDDT
jgi:hypothetical protein